MPSAGEESVSGLARHLFIFAHTQYILVTNTRSLYSVVMAGRGITDDDRFLKATLSHMATL